MNKIIPACLLLVFIPCFVIAEEAPSAVAPLMKLIKSGRVPKDKLGTILEMICNRGNEHDLQFVLTQVLDPALYDTKLRVRAIDWLTEAASTRKLKPSGDLDPIRELINEKDEALRIRAVRLASTWKVTSTAEILIQLAKNRENSGTLRREAVAALVSIQEKESQELMVALTSEEEPGEVRRQAVIGLTRLDLPLAALKAAEILKTSNPEDELEGMIDAFLGRRGGADELASAITNSPPEVDVAKRVLRYMYSIGRSDQSLSDALCTAAGISSDPTPPTPEEITSIVQEVGTKGDPVRGEAVFRRKDMNCMRCHSLSRAGGQVGPDLSAVGGSSPIDYIVNSILNPNLAVKEQYVTKVFETSDGLSTTGVVIDRDESRIRVRDGSGKIVIIPTKDVDEEVAGPSLMPVGLTRFLTREELIDLARFISELGKPGPYRIREVPSIQRWKVMSDPPKELVDAAPHLDHVRDLILGNDAALWTSAYARVGGVFPIDELYPPKEAPKVLILQGEVQVNVPGEVTFAIETNAKTQVWIDANPFPKDRLITLKLDKGLHKLIIRVEPPAKADSPSETKPQELQVELHKPENSTAIFEAVGGM